MIPIAAGVSVLTRSSATHPPTHHALGRAPSWLPVGMPTCWHACLPVGMPGYLLACLSAASCDEGSRLQAGL